MSRGEKAFSEESLIVALKPLGSYLPSVVVCGSWTIFIYRHRLYKCAGPKMVVTRDLDIAVPRSLPIVNKRGLRETLLSAHCKERRDPAGLRGLFSDEIAPDPMPRVVHFEVKEACPYLEFITPLEGEPGIREVQKGLAAAQLKYLDLLLVDPLDVAIPTTSLTLRVAAPAAWLFQKGLSFPDRRNRDKKAKDLANLFDVLNNFPEEQKRDHLSSLKRLVAKYPEWRRALLDNLRAAFPSLDGDGVRMIAEQRGELYEKFMKDDPTRGAALFRQTIYSAFKGLLADLVQ
jgi:hypothetical protein